MSDSISRVNSYVSRNNIKKNSFSDIDDINNEFPIKTCFNSFLCEYGNPNQTNTLIRSYGNLNKKNEIVQKIYTGSEGLCAAGGSGRTAAGSIRRAAAGCLRKSAETHAECQKHCPGEFRYDQEGKDLPGGLHPLHDEVREDTPSILIPADAGIWRRTHGGRRVFSCRS